MIVDRHRSHATERLHAGTGHRVVSGSGDCTAKIWDVETGVVVLELHGHDDTVRGCDFSPDGLFIVTCGHDLQIIVWDATTGRQLLSCEGHTDFVYSVCYSPDALYIASGPEV